MRHSTLILCALALAHVAGAAGVAMGQIPVTLRFRSTGGSLLPVRAGVFTGSIPRPPSNQAATMYQVWGSQSWFYCSGSAVVSVPAGPVTIRAGRGFEYLARDTTLTVTAPVTVTVTLRRFIDMKSLGYFSGDTHVHISHPPLAYELDAQDLLLATKAEDLNMVNSMEEQTFFTGALHPSSQWDRLMYFSKEQRNAHFSHMSILGMKEWIYDQGCVEQGVACGRTLAASIHAELHAQPGETAVIATHPFSTVDMQDITPWPGGGMWRAMAIDLPAGAVDAMDLLTYSDAPGLTVSDAYFEALNAGFRLPPSAGTDCTLGTGASGPAGGYRVYVFLNETLSLDGWIAGLKAGRSFVSNYPLFTHFDLEGVTPGGTLQDDDAVLHGSVSLRCGLPVQEIEIIGDTGLLEVIHAPGGGAKAITATFAVARPGLTWVVARAIGAGAHWHVASKGASLFAQTAPIYLESAQTSAAAGQSGPARLATRVAAADYFLDQLDEVEAVFNAYGYFPGESRAAFDDAVAFARQYYTALLTAPTGAGSPTPPSAWAIADAWPNPFSGEARLSYVIPRAGGAHTVDVFDAAGRAVRQLYAGSRPGGEYQIEWDGRDTHGRPVASGVYFVRLTPRGDAPVVRKLVLVH